tara:strand:+ start:2251 stop:2616 length:366 start_codon:yes stop_codon:yes gene_type:complete
MSNAHVHQNWLTRLLSGGGALGGFAAFLGASCCVIPILLVHFGVATSLVARLGWFAQWQPYFVWFTAGLLSLAATIAIWRGRSSRAFWLWWGAGAAFLIAALVLPNYEFRLQNWLLDWTRT